MFFRGKKRAPCWLVLKANKKLQEIGEFLKASSETVICLVKNDGIQNFNIIWVKKF